MHLHSVRVWARRTVLSSCQDSAPRKPGRVQGGGVTHIEHATSNTLRFHPHPSCGSPRRGGLDGLFLQPFLSPNKASLTPAAYYLSPYSLPSPPQTQPFFPPHWSHPSMLTHYFHCLCRPSCFIGGTHKFILISCSFSRIHRQFFPGMCRCQPILPKEMDYLGQSEVRMKCH